MLDKILAFIAEKLEGMPGRMRPVGSIYLSLDPTDPSKLFGGTWKRIEDVFLLAAGSIYSAGSTGGSADAVVVEHSHEQAEHAHSPVDGEQYGFMEYRDNGTVSRSRVKMDSSGRYAIVGTSGANSASESNIDYSRHTDSLSPKIDSSGESGIGKNMPPYLAVYVWQRIA